MTTYRCPGPCCGTTAWPHQLCGECRSTAGRDLTAVTAVVATPRPRPRPGVRIDWAPEQIDGIVAAYQSGTGLLRVALQYGVSVPAIRRVLTEQGVAVRPRTGREVA